jgi:hypothetical protein
MKKDETVEPTMSLVDSSFMHDSIGKLSLAKGARIDSDANLSDAIIMAQQGDTDILVITDSLMHYVGIVRLSSVLAALPPQDGESYQQNLSDLIDSAWPRSTPTESLEQACKKLSVGEYPAIAVTSEDNFFEGLLSSREIALALLESLTNSMEIYY